MYLMSGPIGLYEKYGFVKVDKNQPPGVRIKRKRFLDMIVMCEFNAAGKKSGLLSKKMQINHKKIGKILDKS